MSIQIQSAIVLAGGKGTRLQSVVKDVPKPMANIHNRPFLYYVLQYLEQQGLSHVVLSTGYMAKTIQNHFGSQFHTLQLEYCIETEPLGTGGAIQKALGMIRGESAIITNGDTAFWTNLAILEHWHYQNASDFTIALKDMRNFDRYGVVSIDNQHNVLGFEEKQWREQGYINAGLYVVSRDIFTRFTMPTKFSLEQDFFPKYIGKFALKAYPCEGYFIDIGIPEDYLRCQTDFIHLATLGEEKT